MGCAPVSGLQVHAVVGRRSVDIEVSVGAGEVLAVLGANGAGKSTLLHVIAGLLTPDAGYVRVGERVLTDVAAGVQVATHARRVGLLMQDPLLFPHLSVSSNVAFGPRSGMRLGRKESRRHALRWLEDVDATALLDRKPAELSGGQAQRVALARALAAEPQLVLLDEPLSGLDVAIASAMRQVLRRVLTRDGRAAVLVTHDLVDVVTLADHIVVVESGRVAEFGPAATVLGAPRSRFGARFAGVNLVSGRIVERGTLVTDWGERWHGSTDAVADGSTAVAVFPPSAVAVYRDKPHGSPRNVVEVVIAELDSRGSVVRVRATDRPDGAPGLAADVSADAAADLRLAAGERLYFVVKAQEVVLHAGS